MVITDLSAYQQAILQYHAALNNATLEDAAANYLAAYIASTLEKPYLDAQTATFHAGLKDDATRPTLITVLTAVPATPTAIVPEPPVTATVTSTVSNG
jgi:hypothetical protein